MAEDIQDGSAVVDPALGRPPFSIIKDNILTNRHSKKAQPKLNGLITFQKGDKAR
jgi:hypothetical protein